MRPKPSQLFRWFMLITLLTALLLPATSSAQSPVYLPFISGPGAERPAATQDEEEQPADARPWGVLTNTVDETTVEIAWQTATPQTGWVTYSATLDALDQLAYAEAGQETATTQHRVTLTGLQPDQAYYFAIVSGGVVYDNGGSWYKLQVNVATEVDVDAILAAASSGAGATQAPDEGRIVGGQPATPGEYPWQAMLLLSGNGFCGGSLIDQKWVLTAAHCVDGRSVEQVILGAHNLLQTGESTRQVITTRRAIIHPNYNRTTEDNDIALIELNTAAVLNTSVRVVPLAASADSSLFAPGVLATVTGWGATREGGSLASVLQEVSVPIVSRQTCNQSYSGDITENMLCAGLAQGGKDSCQGDSGGPLIVPNGSNWKLAGVVSWGNGCARPNFYGVYTVVANYSSWIQSYLGGSSGDPDDNRALSSGQTLNGTIDPATDQDTYYFDITQAQLATIRMNRTNTTLDSYLILYGPNGNEIARDDDSGGNTNALINQATLTQTGRYRIVASSFNGGSAGGYTISLSLTPVNACTPGANGVVLYEHSNYGGRCVTFTADDFNFVDNNFNDTASSIRFVGSYATGWEAVLYEHANYGGVSSTFRADDATLTNDTIGNDRASSIRIRRVTNSNLALNRPSFATTQQSASYSPAKGNDGSTSTRWSSRSSSTLGDQWWWVDVGNQTFDRVMVRWHASYAARYFIGWSNDGVNYTGYWFTASAAGSYNHNLGTQTARYVGVLMRTRAPGKTNYSFYELETYRTAALSAAETERLALEATALAAEEEAVTITLTESVENKRQFLPLIQQ